MPNPRSVYSVFSVINHHTSLKPAADSWFCWAGSVGLVLSSMFLSVVVSDLCKQFDQTIVIIIITDTSDSDYLFLALNDFSVRL